jgi:hypothetical protein
LKPLRLNKVIGLSIGERSLLAAEVVAGERPEVARLAEFVYPDGISPQQPAELGTALGAFLRENKFTAKSAIVGLPARWLVVKPKEVPPADAHTLQNMLRLQAEGEFSTELKDLVYDYTADASAGNPKCVLLIATSKRYVDAAAAMCDTARLGLEMVTSSAVALGTVTGRSVQSKNPLVLLVSPSGAELTAQSGTASNAIRHLRGPGPDRPFVGELRRAISGMPAGGTNGTPRELVLWDAAGDAEFDSGTLGESLGLTVRSGDLPIFGVNTTAAASNGEGRKYAAAVALALLGVVETSEPVDFLHSRLAPLKEPTIPKWVMISSLAGVVVLGLVVLAYFVMHSKQTQLDRLNTGLSADTDRIKSATEFVNKVSFAQSWHMGNPRYLACLRDLTDAMPQDFQTYAMALTLREEAPPQGSSSSAQKPVTPSKNLTCRLEGKTSDQQKGIQVVTLLKKKPKLFKDVKSLGTNVGSRGEVSFTVTFTYVPPVEKP